MRVSSLAKGMCAPSLFFSLIVHRDRALIPHCIADQQREGKATRFGTWSPKLAGLLVSVPAAILGRRLLLRVLRLTLLRRVGVAVRGLGLLPAFYAS